MGILGAESLAVERPKRVSIGAKRIRRQPAAHPRNAIPRELSRHHRPVVEPRIR